MAQAEVESLGARPACAPRAHPPSPRDPLARESVKSALGVLIDSSGGLPTGMVPINSQGSERYHGSHMVPALRNGSWILSAYTRSACRCGYFRVRYLSLL